MFFFCCCLGNDKIIDLLIKNGANVDLPDNNNQRTALHYAAYNGSGFSLYSFMHSFIKKHIKREKKYYHMLG